MTDSGAISTPIGTIEVAGAAAPAAGGQAQMAGLLLLLHASATSPRSLQKLADALAMPDWRLIAPVLDGYGGTQLAAGAPERKPDRNRAIASAVLDHFPARRRVVFGHSMGGQIALLTALDQHARGRPLDAVILYEPILHSLLDERDPADAEALAWERPITRELIDGVRRGAPEGGVRGFIEAWNEVRWDSMPDAVRQALIANAEALAHDVADLAEQRIPRAELAGLETPVLLLRGSRSPDFVKAVNARARDALPPSAQEDVLAGCGHMAPIMAPETVATSVRRFLLAGLGLG